MWPLIFVCCAFSATVLGEVFNKCCSSDETLVKFEDQDATFDRYECMSRNSVENNYNISISPLIVSDSVDVISGIPECGELPLIETDYKVLSTDGDGCYDRLVAKVVNGTLKSTIPQLVALKCGNETETLEPKLKIDNIRKCCPPGQAYDTEYHVCRDVEEVTDEDELIASLVNGTYIYEVDRGLHCKTKEYSVELSEEWFNFKVVGSSLSAFGKVGDEGGVSPRGQWCVDRKYGEERLVARVCTRDCGSYGAYCLRKCCPVGQHYRTLYCGHPVSICVPNTDDSILFNISYYMDPLRSEYTDIDRTLGIQVDLRCESGKVVLNSSLAIDKHYLDRKGLLHSPVSIGRDYCFESFDARHCPGEGVTITAAICFVKGPEQKDFRMSFVLICISSAFLALTLLVYIWLPELRNLHGRTLICHVSMMLLAFCCLASVQYDQVPNTLACTMLGYGIYFGFVSAFAWLNVMCADIWWTFGSVRTVQPLRKSGTEWRRFLWYSLYAWGVAILLTLTMFLLDRYPVAKFLDANIGHDICWFGSIQNSQSDWPHYIFFVIPMGLVTCTNFVFWVLTARHCARVKSEVHRLQAGSVGDRVKRRFRVDRAKYILTGKLWVVMGAGWVSELLSTLTTEPLWLWTIIDLINELQGVFIFLILVCKPKLYYLIRKKLGLEKPDAQKNGTSSSARTSSTFLSRTISTDERAHLRTSMPSTKP